MTHEFVIETDALTKRYGGKLALDHLDLRIPRGRIHAIVGANGAGKSTLFRILLGFLPPTAGSARILGRDSQRLTPEDRGRIGFVNEEHTLPTWMRVNAVTAMHRRQYPRWNEAAFQGVLGHYHVLPEQKVSQLSRGERAGFNLALALAQGPELLVLDEPTLGLDVVAKRAFLESLMYSNATDDCTVIYCSHQMEEIERVADNLVILERGRLMHMSAPDEFCARVTHWVADIPFKGPDPRSVPGLLQLQRLDGLVHYLVLDQDEDFAEFLRAAGAQEFGEVFILVQHQVVVQAIQPLQLQQARHGSRIRPLERNVGHPVRHACAELVGRRHVHQAPALEDDQVVRHALDFFHLVRAIDDGAVVGRIAVHQRFEERPLGDDIQAERGFVEHQQFRPLRQREREVETGAFAARELPDLLLRQQ